IRDGQGDDVKRQGVGKGGEGGGDAVHTETEPLAQQVLRCGEEGAQEGEEQFHTCAVAPDGREEAMAHGLRTRTAGTGQHGKRRRGTNHRDIENTEKRKNRMKEWTFLTWRDKAALPSYSLFCLLCALCVSVVPSVSPPYFPLLSNSRRGGPHPRHIRQDFPGCSCGACRYRQYQLWFRARRSP